MKWPVCITSFSILIRVNVLFNSSPFLIIEILLEAADLLLLTDTPCHILSLKFLHRLSLLILIAQGRICCQQSVSYGRSVMVHSRPAVNLALLVDIRACHRVLIRCLLISATDKTSLIDLWESQWSSSVGRGWWYSCLPENGLLSLRLRLLKHGKLEWLYASSFDPFLSCLAIYEDWRYLAMYRSSCHLGRSFWSLNFTLA